VPAAPSDSTRHTSSNRSGSSTRSTSCTLRHYGKALQHTMVPLQDTTML
jgi:hypothetical protein